MCRWIPNVVGDWIAQRYYKAVRILGSLCFTYRAVPDQRYVTLWEAGIDLMHTAEFEAMYEADNRKAIAFATASHAVDDARDEALAEAEETERTSRRE
jgi:hypothetical protein